MTGITTPCPECLDALDFARATRHDPVRAVCTTCGYEFVMSGGRIERRSRVRCSVGA